MAASPAQSAVKSVLPCCSALARNGAKAGIAIGNSGATPEIGPASRVSRLTRARAGRPVNTLVSTVAPAFRRALRYSGGVAASGQSR